MSETATDTFTTSLAEQLESRLKEIEEQLAAYSGLVEERDRIAAALAALREP